MDTKVRYYKKKDSIGMVLRAYVDFEGKYRIDFKKAVTQFVARGRNHSDAKAGILETNRVFETKQEANDFFIEMRDKNNLIPAEVKDWEHFNAD